MFGKTIVVTFMLALLLQFRLTQQLCQFSHTPGCTHPYVVEIEVGASANITCIMNRDIFNSHNATELYFIEENTLRKVPQQDIEVLNSTAVMFKLYNATEQQSSYLCKLGKDAIMASKVYVGRPPGDVLNFSCRSYDFEYMTCNYTEPRNPLLTRYNLTFYTHLSSYVFDATCNHDAKPLVVCNITSQYRTVDSYYFTLHSWNVLGNYNQSFTINNLDVMVPAKPGMDIVKLKQSTDSYLIAWRVPKLDYYPHKALHYEILLKPDNFEQRNLTTNAVVMRRTRDGQQLELTDLPYAYYHYKLSIRVRVATAVWHDEVMWSETFVHEFTTDAKRPDRPPRTSIGSFFVNSSETQVRLYWEQLEPHEYNGRDFTYIISSVQKDGNIIQLTPIYMEANSAIFAWSKDTPYVYEIRSQNHMGTSLHSSRIEIPARPKQQPKYYTPQTIHNVYNATNKTYTLTWEPPRKTNGLTNYTVYWCYSKPVMQNECKGSIHFQLLDKHVHNFTTKSQAAQQEHTLNLAVSANYIKYNTGLHWTACTIDVNSDLIKMEPEVQTENSTAIKVQWSPESVCPSILEGYNLTYCEVAANATENAECLDKESKWLVLDKNAKKAHITDLLPFTNYKIGIYMYSILKQGIMSEPLVVRTFEGAPTPPRQLHYKNITRSTATIAWEAPSHPNGKIRSYVVILNGKNVKVPAAEHANEQYTYVLRNLSSYESYKVYVLAETVESSPPSNDIHFTTKQGFPSEPINVIPLNETNNETIIAWTRPQEPAGHIHYYEVAVTHMRRDKIIGRRISFIDGKTSTCGLKVPVCLDHEYKTTTEVRAVNAVDLSDIKYDDLLDEYKTSGESKDYNYYFENDELTCTPLQAFSETRPLKDYRDAHKYRLYKSKWQPGPTYACSKNRLGKITIIALLAIMGSLVMMSALYFLRKQYYKMANINCTLPASLDSYFTKDGFVSDFVHAKDNEMPQLQRAPKHDEFLLHNEKHHLLKTSEHDNCGLTGDYVNKRLQADADNVGRSLATATTASPTDLAALHTRANAAYMRSQSESSADSLIGSSCSGSIDSDTETQAELARRMSAAASALNGEHKALQRIAEHETNYITANEIKSMTPMQAILPNANGYINPTTKLNWPAVSAKQQSPLQSTNNSNSNDEANNKAFASENEPEESDCESESEQAVMEQKQALPLAAAASGGYVSVASVMAQTPIRNISLANNAINANGYVQPNQLQKFANAKQSSQMSPAMPAVMPRQADIVSGYVQPNQLQNMLTNKQQQPVAATAAAAATNFKPVQTANNLSGYTTLEELQKNSANTATEQMPLRAQAVSTTLALPGQGSNISGYVTPGALSAFGQQQQQQQHMN